VAPFPKKREQGSGLRRGERESKKTEKAENEGPPQLEKIPFTRQQSGRKDGKLRMTRKLAKEQLKVRTTKVGEPAPRKNSRLNDEKKPSDVFSHARTTPQKSTGPTGGKRGPLGFGGSSLSRLELGQNKREKEGQGQGAKKN